MKEKLYINIRGRLIDFDRPKVMGILNITPDSFYSKSRNPEEGQIRRSIKHMLDSGADIIDVGGCSTRPGFSLPSEEEEWRRVDLGCRIIKEISDEVAISVDTFRSEIAEKAIKKWKVDIINDISGGTDSEMWNLIARENVVYVLTHNSEESGEDGSITARVITTLSKKINELHRLGVNDILIDPGFGFAKTAEQNFKLLAELDEICRMGYPVLIGISRKSMIYRSLGATPEEALAGTVALDAIALEKGAHILRVHDVKEATDTVELFFRLKQSLLK